MTTSAVRFGTIGLIHGPKAKAEEFLKSEGHQPGGIYFAENWAPGAKTGDEAVFAYVTGKHLEELKGEKPTYDQLHDKYNSEYQWNTSGSGSYGSGHEFVVSNARSGELTRLHKISFTA